MSDMQKEEIINKIRAMDVLDTIEEILSKYHNHDLEKATIRHNIANEVHSLIVTDDSNVMSRNDAVLVKLAERLDVGQLKYGKSIPRDDGRNWIKESLEEILDAMVYVANTLLIIDEENKEDE
jgi:hypothetical protein|tara:strand:+ start:486 stop:854 length:369 start_codon:yes stop_codon:yes gene_type:complete